jgi:hypothetical protein
LTEVRIWDEPIYVGEELVFYGGEEYVAEKRERNKEILRQVAEMFGV